jgi:hypothetical protein
MIYISVLDLDPKRYLDLQIFGPPGFGYRSIIYVYGFGSLDLAPNPNPFINNQNMKKNLDNLDFLFFLFFIFDQLCKGTFKKEYA